MRLRLKNECFIVAHLAGQMGVVDADLYDPIRMPSDLVKAHEQLDRAVALWYRPKPFSSDRERVEFLFELYENRLGKAAIAFRDVGSNGQRCAVHLVGQMVVSGWKLFS